MTSTLNPYAAPKTLPDFEASMDPSVVDWDLRLGELPVACVATNRTKNIYKDVEYAFTGVAECACGVLFVPIFGLIAFCFVMPVLKHFKQTATFTVWRCQGVCCIRFVVQAMAVSAILFGNGMLGIGWYSSVSEICLIGVSCYVMGLLLFSVLIWLRLDLRCQLLDNNTIRMTGLHANYAHRVRNAVAKRTVATDPE